MVGRLRPWLLRRVTVCCGGEGRDPGGTRGWPEGISEAYCRTLSTEMKRMGMRLGEPTVVPGRWVAPRAEGRSLASVTCQGWVDRQQLDKKAQANICRLVSSRRTRTEGPRFADILVVVIVQNVASIACRPSSYGM